MAIKVAMDIQDLKFDGTTLAMFAFVIVGANPPVTHTFSGLAANIVNAAAIAPYLKSQMVQFVQSEYGVTISESEIAVRGVPQ